MRLKKMKAENGLELRDPDVSDKSPVPEIWGVEDLMAFAGGKISDIFGESYAVIDTYPRRVRLPMPPYLLVSRVTRLNAARGEYRPSSLTTEYDIPYGSPFSVDGQIAWAVVVESGQCDLLLISYIGIDFENKGEYVYRLLDCSMTFLDDIPFEGQTLRYDIYIDRFAKVGNNLLFFFRYECFVQDRQVLRMDGGCAGFFSDAELASGQGVLYTQEEISARRNRPRKSFAPLLACDKTAFSDADIKAVTKGDLAACFGDAYDPRGANPSLRLPLENILMIHRVRHVDPRGGSCGLGLLEAEFDLAPDDWYFPCHFVGDEVLAGSLQAEGCCQLVQFFMLYLGMQRLSKDARFQPVRNLSQKVRCRKEIPPKKAVLTYRMDVKEIGLVPEPYVIADVEVIYDGYVAVIFEDLGSRLQEKNQPAHLKSLVNTKGGVYVRPVDYEVVFDEHDVTQFALGDVWRCFGDEYKIFEGRSLSRQPNTDLQFISRVRSIKGERHVLKPGAEIVAEYDIRGDEWYYSEGYGSDIPYSILMEIALQPCGFLGAYLGSTLSVPDKDLFFRNLDGEGALLRYADLRGKTVSNRACLVSHAVLGGSIVQRYTFELSVDSTPFYRGSAAFGFFSKDDLAKQLGLDQGQESLPWIEQDRSGGEAGHCFRLDSVFAKHRLFRPANGASPGLRLAEGNLQLLDEVAVLQQGGKYGKGYVLGKKKVHPADWYFTCHFYQDPVMPGSIGVEAMLEALRIFALRLGLGNKLAGAGFLSPAPHTTVWKYRGQILSQDTDITLETHIKDISVDEGRVVISADANLWKGDLRIYEVTDIAVSLGTP